MWNYYYEDVKRNWGTSRALTRYINDLIRFTMMSHEDTFYEIYQEVHSRGQEEVFYKQLEKMKYQDKHRHKCVKDHWEYAYGKITGVHQSHETLFGNTDIK